MLSNILGEKLITLKDLHIAIDYNMGTQSTVLLDINKSLEKFTADAVGPVDATYNAIRKDVDAFLN